MSSNACLLERSESCWHAPGLISIDAEADFTNSDGMDDTQSSKGYVEMHLFMVVSVNSEKKKGILTKLEFQLQLHYTNIHFQALKKYPLQWLCFC